MFVMDEQRITEIETKLAYQEDLICSLNQIIIDMQKQIDSLELRNNVLKENLKEIAQALPDTQDINEVPPHY